MIMMAETGSSFSTPDYSTISKRKPAVMRNKAWSTAPLLLFVVWVVRVEAFPQPHVVSSPAHRPSYYSCSLSSSSSSSSSRLWERKEATFGMGCFWKPSEELLKVPGVLDTVVGYTGNDDGSQPPNYDAVCFGTQWVEGVRVTYDDTKVTYGQLLEAFFATQQPKAGGSRQYASIIFPHDADQEAVARQWLEQAQSRVRDDGVYGGMTTIEPLTPFYKAEGYHQRYWQKFRPRIAVMVGLMAVASGVLDSILPTALQGTVHTVSNGVVMLGCAYVLLERKLDAQVVKLS